MALQHKGRLWRRSNAGHGLREVVHRTIPPVAALDTAHEVSVYPHLRGLWEALPQMRGSNAPPFQRPVQPPTLPGRFLNQISTTLTFQKMSRPRGTGRLSIEAQARALRLRAIRNRLTDRAIAARLQVSVGTLRGIFKRYGGNANA